jgi:hypothetical protein
MLEHVPSLSSSGRHAESLVCGTVCGADHAKHAILWKIHTVSMTLNRQVRADICRHGLSPCMVRLLISLDCPF